MKDPNNLILKIPVYIDFLGCVIDKTNDIMLRTLICPSHALRLFPNLENLKNYYLEVFSEQTDGCKSIKVVSENGYYAFCYVDGIATSVYYHMKRLICEHLQYDETKEVWVRLTERQDETAH